MVFDKSKAPAEPMEFLKWFYEKTAWTSDRDYYDIKVKVPGTITPLHRLKLLKYLWQQVF